MSVKIIEMLIPQSNKRTRPGTKRVPQSITIHETDNTNVRANALAHARLQFFGNRVQASWHYQVDDEPKVYRSIPDNEVAYAAGDGRGPGNSTSIHIEMCVNSDGDYAQTIDNTVELVRYLLEKYPAITHTHVVQHNKWNGKNCPRYLRAATKGINWSEFLKLVREGKAATQPSTPPKSEQTSGQFSIGQKVRVSKSARTYATGQPIAAFVKGSSYTIKQRGSNRMLLNEINSWVKTSDLEVGGAERPKVQANLVVDGQLGPLTITALQRYFMTTVDGKLSDPSLVIKALQKLLAVKQDGYLGPITISALQLRFGTPVDGVLSNPSLVIKELQRRLNRGQL